MKNLDWTQAKINNMGGLDIALFFTKRGDNMIKYDFYMDLLAQTNYPVLIGTVDWTHNADKSITLVFHDMTNDRITTKHYKTERGAKTAETKFFNKINRNKVEQDIKNNM